MSNDNHHAEILADSDLDDVQGGAKKISSSVGKGGASKPADRSSSGRIDAIKDLQAPDKLGNFEIQD